MELLSEQKMSVDEAEDPLLKSPVNHIPVIKDWAAQCEARSILHYRHSCFFSLCHKVTGFLVVVSGGTSITLQTTSNSKKNGGEEEDPPDESFLALLLTIVAMCMASLSFVFGFQNLAANHNHFSTVYGMLGRKLRAKVCELSSCGPQEGNRNDILVQTCLEEWYQLEQIAPYVPP